MKQDELIIALQLAIEQFGTSILDDSKLVNVLLDLGAFKTAPYAKTVIRELIAEGYMQKIMQVGHDENRINTLVSMITSQSGFTLQIVEYIVNCLLFATSFAAASRRDCCRGRCVLRCSAPCTSQSSWV